MLPRFSMKTMLILVSASAVVIAIPTLILQHLDATVRDGYSQHVVVCLLIDFMEENEGKWPEHWNSLKPLYDRDFPDFGPGVFEELKRRVFVDFGADVEKMRVESLANDNPAFRVVFAKYTSGFHPFSEPNSAICNYLRRSSSSELENVASEQPTSETEK